MLFSDYEKPEGWSAKQPEVLIRHEAIDALGMPLVNYDSIEELMLIICQRQPSKTPSIQIHTISPKLEVLGYVNRYTSKIHIDAEESEFELNDVGGTIAVLAHEFQHLADYINHPWQTRVESILKNAFHIGHFIAKKALPDFSANLSPDLGFNPVEKRARDREKTAEVLEHQQDILFPKSSRTNYLLHTHRLTSATITKLGLEQDTVFASDYKRPRGFFSRLLLGQD